MIIDTGIHRTQCKLWARFIYNARVTLALSLISVSTQVAAELSIIPRYDTNPRYRSSEQEIDSAQGILIDFRLPIEYRSQRSSISLSPRVVYSFYSKEENADLEDEDKYLTGTASHLLRQSNIGAGYGYTDLSLRTSELAEGGSGTIRFTNEDSQKSWYLRPYWQYQFSQANSLALNGGYTEVRYVQERISRLFDFDFSNASAALQHAFNNRHSVSVSASFTKFNSGNAAISIKNSSESNSLDLTYSYSWSARTKLSATAGLARTKSVVDRPNAIDPDTGAFCDPALIQFFACEFKTDSTNFIGNLTASHQSETIEYRFVFGQSLTPNANGAEVLRFNINATAKKRFSQRISGDIGISAFTDKNLGNTQFNFSQDFARGNLRINYSFKRSWSFYGMYQYTFNNRDRILFDNFKSQNHFFSVGIRFQGDGWRW